MDTTAVTEPSAPVAPSRARKPLPIVAFTALGVVFGDIGTSPLYAFKACFAAAHAGPTRENVIGIVSVLVWTIVVVVCIKYVTFVMRVDHRGEGGVLALLARVSPHRRRTHRLAFLSIVGIAGAAALLGDGLITPPISVMSAVEGLRIATPAVGRWEVPIAAVILAGLFALQSRGSGKVGAYFGPVMALWFLAIAVSGAVALSAHPQTLAALNPWCAVQFFASHGIFGFLVLGATILCVTGAEALYADMSHFGRGAIVTAWYAMVFPALLLNYLGQGAALLGSPKGVDNPFYALMPGIWLLPAIGLATAATVIASQALVAGAFTLVQQGIAMNFGPRMRVVHTSPRFPGEVFVPVLNAALGVGCILLVLIFRSSSALASAYGLAVALTMASTTVLYFAALVRKLHWNVAAAAMLCGCFLLIDACFVAAGLVKVCDGAWIPLMIAAVLTLLAVIWHEGTRHIQLALMAEAIPVESLRRRKKAAAKEACGPAVLLTVDRHKVPYALHHRWLHAQLPEGKVILVAIHPVNRPYAPSNQLVRIDRYSEWLIGVEARVGYMQTPQLKDIAAACRDAGLGLDDPDAAFVVAAPQLARSNANIFLAARRAIFGVMLRLSGSLPRDIGIPIGQLVEVGLEVRF